MRQVRNGVMALFLVCLAVCGESAAQKKEETPPPKLDGDQLRLKVAKNIMQIVKKLDQPERIELSAEAYFEKERWARSLASFQLARAKEIHVQAHGLVKSTMPEIMQKFMPKYMQAKIMAERKAKKAKGPPSAAEIDKIRADAMAKMQPAMQMTIMPALEKLAKERMDEILKDEKVLTRAMAEQIIKGNFLPDAATARFKTELDKTGYPASLVNGADPILNDRARMMIQSIDIAAVAKKAGL